MDSDLTIGGSDTSLVLSMPPSSGPRHLPSLCWHLARMLPVFRRKVQVIKDRFLEMPHSTAVTRVRKPGSCIHLYPGHKPFLAWNSVRNNLEKLFLLGHWGLPLLSQRWWNFLVQGKVDRAQQQRKTGPHVLGGPLAGCQPWWSWPREWLSKAFQMHSETGCLQNFPHVSSRAWSRVLEMNTTVWV